MQIYFILIIYLYAATGKHITNNEKEAATSIVKQEVQSSGSSHTDAKIVAKRNIAGPITPLQLVQNKINSTIITNHANSTKISTTNNTEKLVFNEKIHKPRIFVTFLTTKLERNRSEPVYVDPFQRILQFFLSSFIRDLTEPRFPFDRNERLGCGHGQSCLKCRGDSNTIVDLLPQNDTEFIKGNSTTKAELNTNVTEKRHPELNSNILNGTSRAHGNTLKSKNCPYAQHASKNLESNAIKNNAAITESVNNLIKTEVDIGKLSRIQDVEYSASSNLKNQFNGETSAPIVESDNVIKIQHQDSLNMIRPNLYFTNHNYAFVNKDLPITNSLRYSFSEQEINTTDVLARNENINMTAQENNVNLDKTSTSPDNSIRAKTNNSIMSGKSKTTEPFDLHTDNNEENVKNIEEHFIASKRMNGIFETNKILEESLTDNKRFISRRNAIHESSGNFVKKLKSEEIEGNDEPKLIYAVVKKGVNSLHSNRRNATVTFEHTTIENRQTPLIEIVKMYPENNKTREGIVYIEPKYSYSTSGDVYTNEKETTIDNNAKMKLISANQVLDVNSTKDVSQETAPKHVNHYFLSISGDADKSVAALNTSDAQIKLKEETIEATMENDDETLSGLDLFMLGDKNDIGMIADDNNNSIKPIIKAFPAPKRSEGMKYSKNYYVFTITIPIIAAFALLMGGLCFCLRSSGACCRLFLTDPSIEIEVKK